jgi:cell division protein FtsI/penicillin-binding protein 2
MVGQVLADSYQQGVVGSGLPQTGIAGAARTIASGVAGAPEHAWFVGYAPVAAPRVAVAVIVEHGASGWDVAAPIGVQVLELAQRLD